MEGPSNVNANLSDGQQCPPLSAAPAPALFHGSYHRKTHSEAQFLHPEGPEPSQPFSGFEELGSQEDLFSYMDIEKLGLGSGSGSASYSAGAKPSAPRPDKPFSIQAGDGAGNYRPRHRQSLSAGSFEARKAMSARKLIELYQTDPKRAKRIMANRQSAARSKERKAQYILDLEEKVHTLETEATNRSAKLSLFQRNLSGLSSENRELKLRLEFIENQVKYSDAMNEQLKNEVERFKFNIGDVSVADAYNLGMAHMQYPQQQPQQFLFQQQHQQTDAPNLQQMTHQFNLFQPNNNQNPNMASSFSRPSPPTAHQPMYHATSSASPQSNSFSEAMHQYPLSMLQGFDIGSCSRGSNLGWPDSVSESSSTM